MNKEQEELDTLLELSNQAWLEFVSELPSAEDWDEILKPCTDEQILCLLREFWDL